MMPSQLRVSFLQLPLKTDQAESNRRVLFTHLQKLLPQKNQLIMLPEFYLGGTAFTQRRSDLAKTYASCRADLRQFAKQANTAIFGSYLEQARGHFYNSAELIGPDGTILGHYRKIHLFGYEHEERVVSAGKEATLAHTPWGPTALLICYDLRFPELLRALTLKGARVVLVCAQWPITRSDHWLTLLKARAIENQVYVIACNRIGNKGPLLYRGHSVVISPWGDIEFMMKNRISGSTEIDLAPIDAIRKRFPALSDTVFGSHPKVPVRIMGLKK